MIVVTAPAHGLWKLFSISHAVGPNFCKHIIGFISELTHQNNQLCISICCIIPFRTIGLVVANRPIWHFIISICNNASSPMPKESEVFTSNAIHAEWVEQPQLIPVVQLRAAWGSCNRSPLGCNYKALNFKQSNNNGNWNRLSTTLRRKARHSSMSLSYTSFCTYIANCHPQCYSYLNALLTASTWYLIPVARGS